jgi:arginyl-tRNA synthetase
MTDAGQQASEATDTRSTTARLGRFDDEAVRERLEGLVRSALRSAAAAGDLPELEDVDTGVSRTSDASRGDWTSTVAMRSAKAARRSPRDIASALAAHMDPDPLVGSVEVAGPGYLNFRLSDAARVGVFAQVRDEGADFGRNNDGAGRSINVEFVSANPVGPMHVGHGRWAALGDSLCRVLEHSGWNVTREFYINDAGSQMDVFARSIDKRYRQLASLVASGMTVDEAFDALEEDRIAALDDEDGTHPETHPLTDDFVGELGKDSYGGAYIIDTARHFYDMDGSADLDLPDEERVHGFRERGYALMLDDIKTTLARCGTNFDVWFSERTLHAPDENGSTAITRTFDQLRAKGLLFEDEGALWFRSTEFGDDKDRVLVKSDGSYTYFAADLAYHANKLDRGFDKLIDIWGADHHGYIPRMQAAVSALGHEGALEVLLGQLVNLLRGGVPVRMSKRRGTMVTFKELLDLVGSDAARFTLLSRSSEQEIDFDIEVAQRKSADNPVYYVQYAHARICSILAKAAGREDASGLSNRELDALADELVGADPCLELLTDPSELALARCIAGFSTTVRTSASDLAPFRLTYYATDLAAAFHSFYTNCHVLTDDAALTSARLAACDATRKVLELALSLVGVSAPVHM